MGAHVYKGIAGPEREFRSWILCDDLERLVGLSR